MIKTYIFKLKTGKKTKIVAVPEFTIGRAERLVRERHKNARTIDYHIITEASDVTEIL